MDCPSCATSMLAFAVPEEYAGAVPDDTDAVAICPRCLTLEPATPPEDEPSFEAMGDGFPSDPEAGIPMALLVGLLDSLALYRSEISDLLSAVERAGVDPLLVLDRLAADSTVETDLDLRGRRKQLEQLL